MSLYFLTRENAPRCFTLSFDQSIPAIILGIHQTMLFWFISNHKKWSIFKDFQEVLKKENLKSEFQTGQYFGFGGVFTKGVQGKLLSPNRENIEDFVYFSIVIPTVEKDVGVCEDCNGSGEDQEFSSTCLHCNGSGREREMIWEEIQLISATLAFLGETILNLIPKEAVISLEVKQPYQLLSFRCGFGGGRSFISSDISSHLWGWLQTKGVGDLAFVGEVTYATWIKIFPAYARFGNVDFKPKMYEKGRLAFDVPGSATGLFINSVGPHYGGSGKEMLDHNVDSPAQQLSLLAGLAALHDLAVKEIG